jgi:hypothetical protein
MFKAQARTTMSGMRPSLLAPALLAITLGLTACAGTPDTQPVSGQAAVSKALDDAAAGSARAPWQEEADIAASATMPAAVGQLRQNVALNPTHPDSYTVQRGDTLWGISARFLREPWFWPEIWQVNPQIANPHLIYPGDIISLVYIDGQPRLTLERGSTVRLSPSIREEPIGEAIHTIPFDAIRAFLSRPSVLTREQANELPYVLTFREGKLMAAAGEDVYVRGTNGAAGSYFSVVNIGEALVDPDDGAVVGYQGTYTGRGRIRRSGDPATLFLTDSQRETLRGDRLVPEELLPNMNFVPRAPRGQVEGSVIAVKDGMSLIGPWMVVVINRGARDGIEPGHVLQVYQAGGEVIDDIGGVRSGRFGRAAMFAEKVQLPEELAATIMVFRAFDRISYALVMQSVNEFRALDKVRSPGN